MRVSIQRVALKDIVANRYRKIESYRLSDEKLEALIHSYENSGFWDGSIQGRPHPRRKGKIEIAFGHHRIEAARRHGLDAIGLVVANRSDADMLRMMADENREEFKGDHLVQTETVAATIEAYVRGEIELPPISPYTNKAQVYAPCAGRAYSLGTVAKFLGWIQSDGHGGVRATDACQVAFNAYHARGNIVAALQTLPHDKRTRTATEAVITAVQAATRVGHQTQQSPSEIRKAERDAARAVVKEIADDEKGIASRIRERSRQIGRTAAKSEPILPTLPKYVSTVIDDLQHRTIEFVAKIDEIMARLDEYLDEMATGQVEALQRTLKETRERTGESCATWEQRLSRREVRNVTPERRRLHA
jgi:ParB-like nuclease domain